MEWSDPERPRDSDPDSDPGRSGSDTEESDPEGPHSDPDGLRSDLERPWSDPERTRIVTQKDHGEESP